MHRNDGSCSSENTACIVHRLGKDKVPCIRRLDLYNATACIKASGAGIIHVHGSTVFMTRSVHSVSRLQDRGVGSPIWPMINGQIHHPRPFSTVPQWCSVSSTIDK
ncbi:hypothetical protein HBI38_095460 [Parastagonospora nodorum]|nr:hypothetical protein HBH61_095120 [Parastagonospora nodorum]KAH4935991.1 hypothetical protein HBI79_075310 [Parastagonospora nodorum]KAH5015012.1 hypothetical protein HBI74_177630 [Parastagonospora nodorum]KAH5057996.1 hypothetical protein HBH96_100930 [Parastagonospora nodorum]KAH5216264.1 hypothetical protein HBI62_169770 [Parastagonospora nodorum]